MALRISVLSSGAILLDGQPVDLADLDAALMSAKETSGSVWYYRESVPAEPPPLARTVLELLVKWKLPISLSSKPDFSDCVDPRTGQSHPRAPTGPAAATLRIAWNRACRMWTSGGMWKRSWRGPVVRPRMKTDAAGSRSCGRIVLRC